MGADFNLFRRVVLAFQRVAGTPWLLNPLEKKVVGRRCDPLPPPVFIIGPPRTGSTLLFQLLVQAYHFAYLTNLQSFFYGAPVAVGRLTRRFRKTDRDSRQLNSKYGYVRGVFSPSEAGKIFQRWFGERDVGPRGTLETEFVRRSVCHLSLLFCAPFLSKNLNNSIRMDRISQIFPEALFVWIQRNPLYTAQSLLKMRRDLFGTDALWASVKPNNYESVLRSSPYEQVVWQVKSIDDYIEGVIRDRNIQNVILIRYEMLCKEPAKVLSLIADNYEGLYGAKLKEKKSIPGRLNTRDEKSLPDQEWRFLVKAVEKIYGVDQASSSHCASLAGSSRKEA